ncbi:MAG: diguanylate cyclase [Candidatus Hydrogenedentes bacterium]|nr:diguanylate cyclase [Candidatus Hydrogenedentota bacterium]
MGDGPSQSALSSFGAGLPEAYLIFRSNGEIAYINPRCESLLGALHADLEGLSIFSLIPEQDGPVLRVALSQMASGRGDISIEARLRVRDGSYGQFAWHACQSLSGGEIHVLLRPASELKRIQNWLFDGEARHRRLVDNLKDHCFLYAHNPQGMFTFVSASITNLLGYTPEEFIRNYDRLFSENHVNDAARECAQLSVAGIKQETYEVALRHKHGEVRWFEISEVPIFDALGKVEAVEGMAHDITARKQAEQRAGAAQEALESSEERFRLLVQHSSDVIIILDSALQIMYISPAIEANTGFDTRDWMEQNPLHLVHPDDRENLVALLQEVYEHPHSSMRAEYRTPHRSGSWVYWESIACNLLHEPSVHGLVLNCRNITERKQAEDALAQLAQSDPLTGVFNRRCLLDTAQQEVQRALRYPTPISVLMLDLDHFKQVNDTYGHTAGDDSLCAVAEVCLRILRDVDIFGRLGGEEFVAVLPETTLEGAEDAAERLRKAIAEVEIESQKGAFRLSVSIGVSCFHEGDKNFKEILGRADEALYQAKEGGRNRVVVHARDRVAGEA